MKTTLFVVGLLLAWNPLCSAERDMPTLDAVRVAAADSQLAAASPSVILAKEKTSTVFDSVATVPGAPVQGPAGELLGAQRTYQAADVAPVNLTAPPVPDNKGRKGILDGGLAGMLPMALGAGIGGGVGWLAAGALGISGLAGIAYGGGIGLAAAFLLTNGQPMAGMGLLGGVLLGAFLFPANPILGGLAIGLGLAVAGYLFNNFFPSK